MCSSSQSSQAKLFFGQHGDAATFGGFVRHRRQMSRFGQLLFGHADRWNEASRLTIAQRDRAGLVEQQHIHISGSLHGPS